MSDSQAIEQPITTVAEYISALDTLCALAQKTLYIFERDFVNIGFNSNSRYEILKRFLLASPHNKLQFIAHNTRPIFPNCPQLIQLSRQFSHNFQIFQTPRHLQNLSEAFAVADEAHSVRRFHMDATRGLFTQHDRTAANLLKSRFDEILQASKPSPDTGSFIL